MRAASGIADPLVQHRQRFFADVLGNAVIGGESGGYNMGPLPVSGGWARLEIPASLLRMEQGTVTHANIAAAAQRPFECTVGWIAHYTIGIVLAVVFVAMASGEWLVQPTLLPALLYGIGTVMFPFFLMQPSLGLGIAASRTSNPTQARLKSLGTHTVFGLGLYLCALGVSYVLRSM